MCSCGVIVLKFGGSVLTCEDAYTDAADEASRFVRDGFKVVAVVSAIEGRTEELIARAARLGGCDGASAALIGTGELESAALLGLALDRAGAAAHVLDAAAVGLRTTGGLRDAEVESLDAGAFGRAFESCDVIVVPGFVGRDGHGRKTLLGRGGSDLTAFFIASELGGRCRLIKDVDGLYERDPALPGPRPRRYESLGWDEALGLDESIVQHKGVRFARDRRLRFEVASHGTKEATHVGDEPVRFFESDTRVVGEPEHELHRAG